MVPDSSPPATPRWHAVDAPAASGRAAPSPVPAILVVLTGIVATVVLGLTVDARTGALTLAATLAVAGAWRATSPTGPAGLAIRSRGFDVFLCWSAATGLSVLALTAPGI
ncbi:DUF3017 domain-containing protein [Isoptericola jiangsuensis]|uniref:DUF3017 domain-containing protein n=1 Tax=Isoptericola jiangsuensis TaxID=548579 RepID=UPI000BF6E215|nr:DUF3017 domain-containing protein [Isoptericola jiangsuensis]